jgi:hypothetical protein
MQERREAPNSCGLRHHCVGDYLAVSSAQAPLLMTLCVKYTLPFGFSLKCVTRVIEGYNQTRDKARGLEAGRRLAGEHPQVVSGREAR